MKGVLLAGGTGSRLSPLTKVLNKHLLHVGKYPMIYHPIYTLKKGGVTDLMIISGKEHLGSLISQLGSGSDFGMEFTYRIQDKADGIAGALKLCEKFLENRELAHFPVILGDNIFLDDLDFKVYSMKPSCKLFIKEVEDPNRFGVAVIQDGDMPTITKIIEKPKEFVSNYAVTGVYVFDDNIWKLLFDLKKSDRGEYEISDINNWYINNGNVYFDILKNSWTDAGTHESLIKASNICKDITYDK